MLWASRPSIVDRVQVFTILSSLIFFFPGLVGYFHVDELSSIARTTGKVIYALWLSAYTVTLAINIHAKKLIAQNERFTKGKGWNRLLVPQGIRSNAAWLFLPIGVALWGTLGYFSILYGPVYMIECISTDLACEYMPDLR